MPFHNFFFSDVLLDSIDDFVSVVRTIWHFGGTAVDGVRHWNVHFVHLLLFWRDWHPKLWKNGRRIVWIRLEQFACWFAKVSRYHVARYAEINSLYWIWNCWFKFEDFYRCKICLNHKICSIFRNVAFLFQLIRAVSSFYMLLMTLTT